MELHPTECGPSERARCVDLQGSGVMDDVTWTLVVAALPVAGAIIVAFVPRWAEVRERRRSRYAEAVEALVAWAEFPYRVARRADDDP